MWTLCSKSHEVWTRAVRAAADEPFEWRESLAFLGVARHELKRSVLEARVVLSAADLRHTRAVAQSLVPLHGTLLLYMYSYSTVVRAPPRAAATNSTALNVQIHYSYEYSLRCSTSLLRRADTSFLDGVPHRIRLERLHNAAANGAPETSTARPPPLDSSFKRNHINTSTSSRAAAREDGAISADPIAAASPRDSTYRSGTGLFFFF